MFIQLPATISRSEAVSLLHDIPGGEFFTVKFKKRGNGAIRIMNCRNRVTKYLSDARSTNAAPYVAADHDLFTTYSMDSAGYRTIPWDGIQEIRTSTEVLQVAV